MSRPAHTLPELVLTLALMALATAIAIPTVAQGTTNWRVRAAVADVVNALVLAREAALARGRAAVFVVDAAHAEVLVTCGDDTLMRRALGAVHGVAIAASGDSVRYAPNGLATGLSNLTLLVARRGRIDSVVVSRLGRVRWKQ